MCGSGSAQAEIDCMNILQEAIDEADASKCDCWVEIETLKKQLAEQKGKRWTAEARRLLDRKKP